MSIPLFSWLNERAAGVLLHPTSLPSATGIGNLGESAHRFLSFLKKSGMKYWQMCPLGPTSYGDSPYQCFSAFAGNPYLIDLAPLVDCGLLEPSDLIPLSILPSTTVDYGALYKHFWPIVHKAYLKFETKRNQLEELYGSYTHFKSQNEKWLVGYSHFMALKNYFHGQAWLEWPQEYRTFEKTLRSTLLENRTIQEKIEAHCFYQYLFFSQFKLLKKSANDQGIELIGDIPIFVATDSADLWTNPELFHLDPSSGLPAEVAGVPPDYFSEDGQLWGNPLYDWNKHAKTQYQWWVERLAINFELFDVLRLDHFRGFESYWAVQANQTTAREGIWRPGPALHLFQVIAQKFPDAKLIAEDLGYITPEVQKLVHDTGLPSMAVLQFAFGSDNKNAFLPHNLHKNQVIYPGTHDNDTALGWYLSTPEHIKDYFRRYLMVDGAQANWDYIRMCYRSVCKLAIIPLQDFFNLGNEARMNYPGRTFGNWQWRFVPYQLDNLENQSVDYLLSLKETFGR